jgi:hypothetical protein
VLALLVRAGLTGFYGVNKRNYQDNSRPIIGMGGGASGYSAPTKNLAALTRNLQNVKYKLADQK